MNCNVTSRSQWPRGLRRRSAAARLLRSWVRIPPGAWMSVCCECCVLSSRGLCDGLITRPEESYRLWCVVVCDLGTSRMRRPWPALGRSATGGDITMNVMNCIDWFDLPWLGVCVCVRAWCVRVCVRACVFVWMCVCVGGWVGVWVWVVSWSE